MCFFFYFLGFPLVIGIIVLSRLLRGDLGKVASSTTQLNWVLFLEVFIPMVRSVFSGNLRVFDMFSRILEGLLHFF